MTGNVTFEVCVDSAEAAVAAQEGGAEPRRAVQRPARGRPHADATGRWKVARARLQIQIMAMVRPRGGDFCYSDVEFAVMREDLLAAKALGADGIVFGLLRPDGTVDRERTRELVELARPLPVTFHRAFDMTRDPFEALDVLIALGVDRLLTSGPGTDSVLEGLDLIVELVKRAAGRMIVMPGGGITARNVARWRRPRREGTALRGLELREGRMEYRNPRVFMGGTLRPPEYAPRGDAARGGRRRDLGRRAPARLDELTSRQHRASDPLERLEQRRPRAAEVDPLEAGGLRPEHRAAVEVDPRRAQEELVERPLVHAQRAAVEEREVRAFRTDEAEHRQPLADEAFQQVDVPLEVLQQVVQPRGAIRYAASRPIVPNRLPIPRPEANSCAL